MDRKYVESIGLYLAWGREGCGGNYCMILFENVGDRNKKCVEWSKE